ncbi:MAG: TonB-dependent receptor plug domain-containing protein [Verrucomicrobiales bacterium]
MSCVLCCCLQAVQAQQTSPSSQTSPANNSGRLTQLSLQELQGIEVTSVSRKEESWLNAPSAIYVITEEDLRRSGVLNIPDALRMAPGFNIAQINANKWAVSSRGFNSRFSNKMLVLVDGRTVYSPVFSGVHWDVQDTLMEDIFQIEAIRGPGGSLWGANAVNGVISIQTKSASDTQGLLTTALAGTEEYSGAIRYGGKLADGAFYRVYAKGFSREDFKLPGSGRDAADEWWQQREGFRVDWESSEQNLFTFQGEGYYGETGDELTLTYPSAPFTRVSVEKAEVSGGHFISRWQHQFSERTDFSLQAYYDHVERDNIYLNAVIDTFDLDFQNRMALGERNELLWGAGYRLVSDELLGSYSSTYHPERRDDHLYNLFLQNQVTVVEDHLFLTLGSKLEHNDYSGWELQPGARLSYKPAENQTAWFSVDRAVRTPSRFEHDILTRVSAAGSPNFRSVITGNRDYDSEELIAYEAGYRIQLVKSLSFDFATFYNDYDDLRTREQNGPLVAGSPTIIPSVYRNMLEGETYGFELAPQWQVTDHWKLSAGYSFLRMALHKKPGSTSIADELQEGDSPQNQFHLRSFLDLPHNLQLDSALYYVDALPNQRISSYTRLDVRLGWEPIEGLEVSFVVQNILDPVHQEFGNVSPLITPTEIERSLYGKVTWRF